MKKKWLKLYKITNNVIPTKSMRKKRENTLVKMIFFSLHTHGNGNAYFIYLFYVRLRLLKSILCISYLSYCYIVCILCCWHFFFLLFLLLYGFLSLLLLPLLFSLSYSANAKTHVTNKLNNMA